MKVKLSDEVLLRDLFAFFRAACCVANFDPSSASI